MISQGFGIIFFIEKLGKFVMTKTKIVRKGSYIVYTKFAKREFRLVIDGR